MKMSLNRYQEHVVIMTVIYNELTDYLYGDRINVRDAEELIKGTALSLYDEEVATDYMKNTVFCSLSKYGEIVRVFTPHLKSWRWERIPALSRAIIIMTYSHYYYVEKVNRNIVIDVAVNLTKTYVDEKQAGFVNALLDEVIK